MVQTITGEHLHNVEANIVAQQAVTAATPLYIGGISVPDGVKIGSVFEWEFNVTKSGAGTASSTYSIVIGTLGTTGDTAEVTFTKPAGTANAAEGIIRIRAVVRVVSATAGRIAGTFEIQNHGTTLEHGHIHDLPSYVEVVLASSTVDTSTMTKIGIVVTTGAADVITIDLLKAQQLG